MVNGDRWAREISEENEFSVVDKVWLAQGSVLGERAHHPFFSAASVRPPLDDDDDDRSHCFLARSAEINVERSGRGGDRDGPPA